MFKNLKQMNSLISEMKKLTNDPNALKDPQAMMESMGIDQDEIEKQLSGLLTKKATLKFTKIHPDSVEPKYNYESDSGFDLHSTEDLEVGPFGRILVPTGLRFDIPMGHEIQVRPKSGLALKQHVVIIPKGMKIAQAVLCPVINGKFVTLHEVIELDEKERGSNGFGSTGI